jgi:hypothetical protein
MHFGKFQKPFGLSTNGRGLPLTVFWRRWPFLYSAWTGHTPDN